MQMLDKCCRMQVLNLWVLSHSPRRLCPLQGRLIQLPEKMQFVCVLCSSQHPNEAPCFSPSQYPLLSAHPTPSLSNRSSSRNRCSTPLSWLVIQICLSVSCSLRTLQGDDLQSSKDIEQLRSFERTIPSYTDTKQQGFPDGSVVKTASDAGDAGCISGLVGSPGGGNGNPLQYSYLENPVDEELGRLQSMESQRVRHNLATGHKHTNKAIIHIFKVIMQIISILP